jgi:predicted nucleic acid-binding protein
VEEDVILVDTNAWVGHLRRRDLRLAKFLLEGRVRTCDVVIGELELGSGLPRSFARDLLALPRLPSPSASETRAFIERHQRTFAGSGVGWADAQIVFAAARAGARLHSSDRNVKKVCRTLDVRLA